MTVRSTDVAESASFVDEAVISQPFCSNFFIYAHVGEKVSLRCLSTTMDPITITVSILSMITLANNVLNTVDRLSKSATSTTRIKTQRIAFRTEIVTMEQWLKNCAMSRSPIESNGEVQKLLEEFHTQTMEVGKLLNVYGFGSGKKESPYKRFASRLKYESGGYEELNEMISLMEKLNKALQTIAPPLPPGYEYAAAGNFSAGRAREAPVRDISEHEEGRLIADDSNHATISSHDDLEAEEHRQSIYDLWHVCCNTFKSMASFGLGHHLALNECHERLKLWGTGLFPNGGLHLDMLVGRSRVLNEKLAVPVASHLVEIALEQRKLLLCLGGRTRVDQWHQWKAWTSFCIRSMSGISIV